MHKPPFRAGTCDLYSVAALLTGGGVVYRYDEYDQRLVDERVAQFRDQTKRYLAGELSDEQFRPLRLMNGLYIQRHAPMLRVAVPYGVFNSTQMRMLARIAREHDRGYGHFTTRQNIQYKTSRFAATTCSRPGSRYWSTRSVPVDSGTW